MENNNLTPKEAAQLINTENLVIIDVRTPQEYDDGCIKNALNIDVFDDNFENNVKKLDKSKKYIIYCRSGKRSSDAFDILQQLGFTNIYNIKGGIMAWEKDKLPLEYK